MRNYEERAKSWLNVAYQYSKSKSGCAKVQVGATITSKYLSEPLVFGANRTYPVDCTEKGCRRQELYGENSKNHRLPSDCRAIHAEIDCITELTRRLVQGIDIGSFSLPCTIVVTRYPCEACARAIANCRFIDTVVYGGEQEISEETREIFKSTNIEVIHIDWKPEYDTDR